LKKLSERLRAVAQQVLPGSVVVDVGTDHAYLPIYLVKQEICPQVIGVEINPGPLRSAVQQVEAAGLSARITIREGDGLLGVQPGEAQIAVLAGMGGKTICEILGAAPEVVARLNRLILQPMGAIPRLREWLYQHQWSVVWEDLIEEDGLFYQLITAEPQSLGKPIQDLPDRNSLEYEIGYTLIQRRHPLLPKYLELRMTAERRILQQLSQSKTPQANLQKELRQQRIAQYCKILDLLNNNQ
jgi:tRNA (adenine22-N1)-methyltransferase